MVCARRWKYDTEVREYFVETSTKQTIRNTELYKRQDVCDAGDALQQKRKPVLSSNCKPKHKSFIRQLKEKEFEKPTADQEAPLALADETGMTPEPERLGDKALHLQHYSL